MAGVRFGLPDHCCTHGIGELLVVREHVELRVGNLLTTARESRMKPLMSGVPSIQSYWTWLRQSLRPMRPVTCSLALISAFKHYDINQFIRRNTIAGHHR